MKRLTGIYARKVGRVVESARCAWQRVMLWQAQAQLEAAEVALQRSQARQLKALLKRATIANAQRSAQRPTAQIFQFPYRNPTVVAIRVG